MLLSVNPRQWHMQSDWCNKLKLTYECQIAAVAVAVADVSDVAAGWKLMVRPATKVVQRVLLPLPLLLLRLPVGSWRDPMATYGHCWKWSRVELSRGWAWWLIGHMTKMRQVMGIETESAATLAVARTQTAAFQIRHRLATTWTWTRTRTSSGHLWHTRTSGYVRLGEIAQEEIWRLMGK